jgi:hypothetical protein
MARYRDLDVRKQSTTELRVGYGLIVSVYLSIKVDYRGFIKELSTTEHRVVCVDNIILSG